MWIISRFKNQFNTAQNNIEVYTNQIETVHVTRK